MNVKEAAGRAPGVADDGRARSRTRNPEGLRLALAAMLALALGALALAPAAGAAPQHRDGRGSGLGHWLFGHHRFHGHGGHGMPHGEGVETIATGLNQPKKLTVLPDGSLLVAESGTGAAEGTCISGEEGPECQNSTGAIARVTPSGGVSTVLSGLASIGNGGEATGPAEAMLAYGSLHVLFQNADISPTTGETPFGPGGAYLGDLVRFPFFGSPSILARFGPFEAANNPDGGEGTGPELGLENPIDSDPYSFIPYHGGWVVADAAADDLLFVSPTGSISVLAVFPTIGETVPPGVFGPEPVPVQAQPVPTSVAVGPDGALYVGQLGGFPFEVGKQSVFRVVPGHAPTVYATGFTSIGDIAFDRSGRLLVLEIDQAGIDDPAAEEGLPTPGAIIGVHRNGSKQLLASAGLEFPTGMAINQWGTVYVSNFGVLSATGGPGGLSGSVARVGLPASWTHSWW